MCGATKGAFLKEADKGAASRVKFLGEWEKIKANSSVRLARMKAKTPLRRDNGVEGGKL